MTVSAVVTFSARVQKSYCYFISWFYTCYFFTNSLYNSGCFMSSCKRISIHDSQIYSLFQSTNRTRIYFDKYLFVLWLFFLHFVISNLSFFFENRYFKCFHFSFSFYISLFPSTLLILVKFVHLFHSCFNTAIFVN